MVTQLVELRRRADDYLRRDGWIAEDEFFYAEQNARLVRDAEEYYQQMYRAEVSSWNLRDRHMAGTLDAADRASRRASCPEPRSSSGSTTRTSAMPGRPQMGDRGELNVGQLARQRYGRRVLLVGFTTYDGTVTAAATGAPRPSASGCDRPCRAATRRSSTGAARTRFWLDTAQPASTRAWPSPASSGQSA